MSAASASPYDPREAPPDDPPVVSSHDPRPAPPHVIRLRAPWEVSSAPSNPPDEKPRTTFVRRFGRPTNLAVGDRVFLVCSELCASGEIVLNDVRLGAVRQDALRTEFDVTAALAERNQLRIELTTSADLPIDAPPGDIRLEIHAHVSRETS